MIYKKLSNTKEEKKEKIVVIHCFRGVNNVKVFKKFPQIMDFLKTNRKVLTKHEWQEDKWDLKVLGFFINIFPSCINIKYGSITQHLKHPSLK
jgi:hypothetical protein